MYNFCCRNIIVQVLIIVVFSIFLSGCGKKAPPKPQHQEKPPVVNDLSYSLDGNNLKLTWTIPEVKGNVKSGLSGFVIYRSKKPFSESECLNCPVFFKRIADIPIKAKSTGKDIITYNEILQKGCRYIYKVVVYTTSGVMGKDSDMVDFTY
ncbi:MAG: hypothetical protein HF982_10305 [Desulfobacteraceae bacterium]|nr:hypothetical protein [Desulfobacteraceae bacterium]MBC2719958.1 hypothetical protein [Desulfobacteraceae bacterium]